MPRLVRRRPLWERVTSMLNPMDYLLWLSEEIETREWDTSLVGTQAGLGLNLLFLIVRANSGSKRASDDIFGDDGSASWLSMLMYPLCWALVAISISNAVYTVSRTRKYRLFEADIDEKPSTPSVRRVRVQSSPTASTSLRLISDLMSADTAESRAHPEKSRDVWELSIWDPLPVCIRLLCLFSPGHVLIYFIFLPLAPLDPRPSVTVLNTLVMQIVLSAQMFLLSSRYSQKAQDSQILQKEVFHEYDTKFVQPRIHPIVRDAGTQLSEDQPVYAKDLVQVGTPTTLIRRSFISHGNPHVESEEPTPIRPFSSPHISAGNVMKPQMFTPGTSSRRSEIFTPAAGSRRSEIFTPGIQSNRSSGLRHSLPAACTPTAAETPVARTQTPTAPPSTVSMGTSTSINTKFGGNPAFYSYNASPLKKSVITDDIRHHDHPSPRNSREMAAFEQRGYEPPSSPTKQPDQRRLTNTSINSSPHPFANMGKHSAGERFPKRWLG
ncbi:uncharacterized protein UV8b_05831 [Ustilaginoidea virens]|uniref:Meiotically up-regulated gene 154 protein n=1 Tax=Ustilaginoidea virens TaxID=1159556 RepID=A0A8E5MIH7_USTVR|nr:uncharacterized protein UV8b_05831 [Ustilaginoidea virens]QUC21588.1 hypothetical protein UV8b_05831 [Ustilaginoidea virens]